VKLITHLQATLSSARAVILFKDCDTEVFTAMMIQAVGFWVVTPYGDMVGHKCFGRSCCLHLQGEEWL